MNERMRLAVQVVRDRHYQGAVVRVQPRKYGNPSEASDLYDAWVRLRYDEGMAAAFPDAKPQRGVMSRLLQTIYAPEDGVAAECPRGLAEDVERTLGCIGDAALATPYHELEGGVWVLKC